MAAKTKGLDTVGVCEARSTDQLCGAVCARDNPSLHPLQVIVTATASGRKWRAALDGETLAVCTHPLVEAARILIAKGLDPHLMIELWHAGDGAWSLRGRLGAVAATLIDGETASRCAKNGPSACHFGTAATSMPDDAR